MILLSEKDDLDKGFISPEIPNNFLTKGRFINNDLPRILLYDNISDALSSRLGENLKGMTFYIYRPKYIRKDNLIEPEINDVPYFLNLYGKEHWYLQDLQLEKVGKIEVSRKKEETPYHYGPRQTTGKMYKWGWEEKLEPWEKSKIMKARKKLFSSDSEQQSGRNQNIALASGIGTGALIGLGTAKGIEKGLDEKNINKIADRLMYKPTKKVTKEGRKILISRDPKTVEAIGKLKEKGKKLGNIAKSKKTKVALTLGTATLVGGKMLHDRKKGKK